MTPQQLAAANIDLVIPGIILLVKCLVAIIGIVGGALVTTLVWVGKKISAKFDLMDSKLTHVIQVMQNCDGCTEAANKIYKRRCDDFI